MVKGFYTIPLNFEYDGADFAVKVNCGYTLDEIKKLLVEKGYNDNNYNIRIGYLRFIWETVNCGTWEYKELEPYGHYREFEKGGRGAMKVYIFEEKKEVCIKRINKIYEKMKKEWEEE